MFTQAQAQLVLIEDAMTYSSLQAELLTYWQAE